MFTLWKTRLSGRLDVDLVLLPRCDVFGSWIWNTYFPLSFALIQWPPYHFLNLFCLIIFRFGAGELLLQSKKASHLLSLILYQLMPDISEEGEENYIAHLIFTLLKLCLRWRGWHTTRLSHNPEVWWLEVSHSINLHIYKALGINTQKKLDDLKHRRIRNRMKSNIPEPST